VTKTASRRPIRVLVIAPQYIIGGHNQQAADLIRNLRKNHNIEADLQPIDPRLGGPFEFLFKIPYLRTACKLVLFSLQLLVRVPRYDVVHAYAAGLTAYVISTLPPLVISKIFRTSFILFYADGRLREHLETWRIAAPTMRWADAIVGASPDTRDVFAQHGLEARVIPNAIHRSVQYRARRRLRPLLLTNRLLEPLYNHPCIFRAFQRVQTRYPEAALVVGNEGALRPQLEKLAAEMELRNCRFLGVRPIEEVPAIYNAADIYLTSPNVDCNPASILECFEAGLPVVATRAGGIPYMVDHGRTGLLVDINDDKAMADCVIGLLEDPDLVERMTNAARAEAEKYQWPTVAESWTRLYQELVDGTTPQPSAVSRTSSNTTQS
jgi:glycosyltransferase involved in cell wall biosynthesis